MTDLAPLDLGALDALQPGAGKAITAAFKLLTHLATINDRRVTTEFRDAMDGITVDTAAKIDRVVNALERMVVRDERWKEEPPHTRPTREDVLARYVDYARAHQSSGHHGKRRVLWNAFFSSFDPTFYKDGMAQHLWQIAKELSYPEAALLARVVQHAAWMRLQGSPKIPVERWLAERLVSAGLASFDAPRSQTSVIATELGHALKQFVWDDDMGNPDGDGKARQLDE